MSDIAHSLVRRAVDVTQQHYANDGNGGDENEVKKIAMWAMALIWTTALLYMAMVSAVSNPFDAFDA